jgi:hypothetical protein
MCRCKELGFLLDLNLFDVLAGQTLDFPLCKLQKVWVFLVEEDDQLFFGEFKPLLFYYAWRFDCAQPKQVLTLTSDIKSLLTDVVAVD